MEKFNQIQYVVGKDDLKELLSEIIDERIAYVIQTWNETNKDDALVSTTKAMEILDVSKTTMWRWKQRGYLVPVRVGGNDRYRLSDVKKLIKPLGSQK